MTMRQDEENVYIEVWDKGKGIQETDKDRIFERLYTADDARTSTTQGSGLGLMIAKRLTRADAGTNPFLQYTVYENHLYAHIPKA